MTGPPSQVLENVLPDRRKAAPPPLPIEAGPMFVRTATVDRVTERVLAYLEAGYPVHLSGPAGTGKTTLAFHAARLRGRPVSLIQGSDALTGVDLMGERRGFKRTSVVDNYIHSVIKTEESVDINWIDNRLTVACETGHTLVYDEFNRTRAEANNVLLSILEEGILSLPDRGDAYLRVHPEFRLILTSNPEEYAGTHRTQNALLDRLITIRCEHYDAATERRIVKTASGCDERTVAAIVALVRSLRGEDGTSPRPTVRSAIALARVTAPGTIEADPRDERFARMAWDILGDDARALTGESRIRFDEFAELLRETMPPPPPLAETAGDLEPPPPLAA